MKRPIKENYKARFESKFDIQDNGCWVWHGYTDDGVPMFPVKRRYRSARQVALHLYKQIEVNSGYVTRSLCKNRLCVNPDHVEIVPRVFGSGETHAQAKLTWNDVRKIRELLTQGLTHAEIARRFGVARSTITHISTKRNWKI